MTQQTNLTRLIEKDSLLELKKMDDFLEIVNHEPPTPFIKDHPMASGVKYLPIDKVEMMLTKLFQQWRVEILREGQMLNSIYTTVRLHYKHPILNEWTYQDGSGAAPIQTDKGKNASDMGAIKSDAIMKALPASKSYAIKDAAENIGKVFGRDLNRRDTIAFAPSYSDGVNYEELIGKAKDTAELTKLFNSMTPEAKKEYTEMIGEKKKVLNVSLS